MDSVKEKIIKGLIVFLLIVTMGLISYKIYYKFKIQPNETSTLNKDKNGKIEPTAVYNNFKNATLGVCNDGVSEEDEKDLKLEIVDGKLIAKLDDNEIDVKGLTGNIKSFVYDKTGCADCTINNEIIIVINKNNELFYTDAYHYKRDNYMTFEKLNINEKIVDVTKLGMDTHFSTCDDSDLAAVLKDGTIKYFKIDFEYDETNGYQKVKIESLDTVDLSDFKISISPYLMIYNDNTIGNFDFEGQYGETFNERLKYNGEILKASKLYYNSNYENKKSYIVYNNKLYMVEHEIDYENSKVNNLRITLINSNKIKKESIDTSKQRLYEYEKDTNIDITFDDGNTYKIESINRVYNTN